MLLLIHIHTNSTLSFQDRYKVVVWDIQTGVVIKDFRIGTTIPEEIAFCGNQIIVLISGSGKTLRVYDVLRGVQLSEEALLPSHARYARSYWGHGDSILLATSFEINGKITINIRDLQPTSSLPFPVIESFLLQPTSCLPFPVNESFLLQPHEGEISFSPVSFHASFHTNHGVIILNVRDLKILLEMGGSAGQNYAKSLCFSPDGHFFAYRTQAEVIHVWKNKSTSYVPWSNFALQFPGLNGFAFSPSAISILSWGSYGIELLDNHLRPPPPEGARHDRKTGAHLVAYSADGTSIATARSRESVITILDPLLDTPQRYINTNMRILEIKIFDNVLFVADENELVSWDLGVGGTGRDAHGVRRGTLDGILGTGLFKISNDCSQIAIVTEMAVFLYDIKTKRILNECKIEHVTLDQPTTDYIWDIRFSPDGHQLRFLLGEIPIGASGPCYCATLLTTKDWRSAEVTREFLEDGWSRDSRFPPPGYRTRVGSGWVEGPGGRKLLWLPPHWRTRRMTETMWDGNFLALVDERHPGPIIIEFQPQPLLPHSCSAHSSNP